MLNRARELFSCKATDYVSIPNLEGLANIQYHKAYLHDPEKFTANDLIYYGYCIYVSGLHYDQIPSLRVKLLNLLADKKPIEKEFLILCFDVISKKDNDHNVFKYEKLIDNKFRSLLFVNYLIESKRFLEAIELLEIKKSIIGIESYLKISEYVNTVSSCNAYDVLFDEGYIKSSYFSHLNYNNPLIITFDPIDSHKNTEPFGVRFCIENGYDVLHFALASRTQYQKLDRSIFEEIAKPIVEKYSHTICYGSSLGGYAALYYSDIFDSDVVALSPLNSSHPLIIHEFKKDFSMMCVVDYIQDLFKVSKTKGKVLFTVDEKIRIDKLFYDKILNAKYPDATVFSMDYSGHPLSDSLFKSGQLKKVILTAFNEKIWDVNTESIKKLSKYWYDMYFTEKNINRENAKTAILKALEIEVTETYVKAAIRFSKAHKLKEMFSDLKLKYFELYPKLDWGD